jgi:hypothetical protein
MTLFDIDLSRYFSSTGLTSIFYLSVIISNGFLYGTAQSTSQIILKVASKFVKSSSSSSNLIDDIIFKFTNGISSNMVNLNIVTCFLFLSS